MVRKSLAACAVFAVVTSFLSVVWQVIPTVISKSTPANYQQGSAQRRSHKGGLGVDAATRTARRARRAEVASQSKSRARKEHRLARSRAAAESSTAPFSFIDNDGNSSPQLCTAGDARAKWLNDPAMHARVHRGAQVAAGLRIVFAGLVHRKLSARFRSLDLEIDSFHALGGSHFLDYRVVLYESNSHPDTLKQLGRLCKHPKLSCLVQGLASSFKNSQGDTSHARLSGMAAMRNIYLDFILGYGDSGSNSRVGDKNAAGNGNFNFKSLANFDVLAVADLDLHSVTEHFLPFRMAGGEANHTYSSESLAGGWTTNAALAVFGLQGQGQQGQGQEVRRRSLAVKGGVSSSPSSSSAPSLGWSVMCSNGVVEGTGRLYDSFALEPKDKGHQRGWVFTERDPVALESCFGGLAFYDLQALKQSQCRYAAADMLCEHTGLHQCLLNHSAAVTAETPRHEARRQPQNVVTPEPRRGSGAGSSGSGIYLFPFLVNQMDREQPRVCVPLRSKFFPVLAAISETPKRARK